MWHYSGFLNHSVDFNVVCLRLMIMVIWRSNLVTTWRGLPFSLGSHRSLVQLNRRINYGRQLKSLGFNGGNAKAAMLTEVFGLYQSIKRLCHAALEKVEKFARGCEERRHVEFYWSVWWLRWIIKYCLTLEDCSVWFNSNLFSMMDNQFLTLF